MNPDEANAPGVVDRPRAEQSPDSLSMAELQWRRFQEAKAISPTFRQYVATWNLRADAMIKMGNLQAKICSLTEELGELELRLSPEERDLI